MSNGSWREFNDFSAKAMPKQAEQMPLKPEQKVVVQRVKGGKGGKTVTVITGLGLDSISARSLLKRLKVSCGSGGTMKKDCLELQGDQVAVLIELLQQLHGILPKNKVLMIHVFVFYPNRIHLEILTFLL